MRLIDPTRERRMQNAAMSDDFGTKKSLTACATSCYIAMD
jgi:hypothetical protein